MPLRVRYHECDPQAVVFNAHYLAYADMACAEVFRELFGSYQAVLDRGFDMVVAESNVRYLAPCRYDDELLVSAYVERVGTTSLVLRFEVQNGELPATEVVNRYVWIDQATKRPAAPPEDIRAAFR
ncbi:acyl-CoA thioesterase [Labedaea rhizosphaerae]|nr:thioesterase family protein [Labedaea rhizosphaerae]